MITVLVTPDIAQATVAPLQLQVHILKRNNRKHSPPLPQVSVPLPYLSTPTPQTHGHQRHPELQYRERSTSTTTGGSAALSPAPTTEPCTHRGTRHLASSGTPRGTRAPCPGTSHPALGALHPPGTRHGTRAPCPGYPTPRPRRSSLSPCSGFNLDPSAHRATAARCHDDVLSAFPRCRVRVGFALAGAPDAVAAALGVGRPDRDPGH